MKILYFTHNTPYPPNKGEKIRSYHALVHLSKEHEVDLFSICKNSEDLNYKADLDKICKSTHLYPLSPLKTKLQTLISLFSPFPLTFAYYFSFSLFKELKNKLQASDYDLIFCSCSSTAQYLFLIKKLLKKKTKVIVDFVDIDSYKWREYSKLESFPMSFIYKIENKRLSKWEKKISLIADTNLVTTGSEKDKLAQINFLASRNTKVLELGVDFEKYSKLELLPEEGLVTYLGQMDYLPNIDAAIYFYINIFPIIEKEIPNFKFQIVGRGPSDELKSICSKALITGEVEDVSHYLRKSSVFVAPLRLSFGVQNKVLEAMASGVPVVATSNVLKTLKAKSNRDLLVADNPVDFAKHVISLLTNENRRKEIAGNAKNYIKDNHDWDKILLNLDQMIQITNDNSPDESISIRTKESDSNIS